MNVYRCRICGAVKSKRGGYFNVPRSKARAMLHIVVAHERDFVETDLETVEI